MDESRDKGLETQTIMDTNEQFFEKDTDEHECGNPADTTTLPLNTQLLSEKFTSWFSNDSKSNDETDPQNQSVPVTFDQLYSIFQDLQKKFGFQKDNMENMYDHMLTQLDSRASRMTPLMALMTLHSNYIGGDQANYKKWFFSCQLDLDEQLGFNNIKLHGKSYKRNKKFAKLNGKNLKEQWELFHENERKFIEENQKISIDYLIDENEFSNKKKSSNGKPKIKHNKLDKKTDDLNTLKIANYKWKLKMKNLSPLEMARQVALYLLCWGEANNIRFTPECLCFIFKCCMDYDEFTLDCKNMEPLVLFKENYYLDVVITPIYNFLKNQRYTATEKNVLIKKFKDHKDIIGYDDVNQLFWYPEGIEQIVLKNGERLVDKPYSQRFLFFKDIEWSKVFYKTYKEKRTWLHCCTNFNRIWIIHFTTFWYFTSFNSPTLYTTTTSSKNGETLKTSPILQVRLTIISFAGTIACLVQLLATLLEFSFVPRKWPGAQSLFKRFIGLFLLFLINITPSIYILFWNPLDVRSLINEIITVVQFFISLFTSVFFSIRPLGGLFKSYLQKGKHKRRYVSSKTFTASFPKLSGRSKWFSQGLWLSVFFCKFIESYFFLTLSLRDPIKILSVLDMSRCKGDWFVPAKIICSLQPKITLFLMILTDLILFFLDTYLWYIICNCFFSIGLSLSLGTSILTPWKNIYSRLPKRMYSKIIASNQMDTRYKPNLLVSQLWNAIIVSIYREHLLDLEHLKKLLYQESESNKNEKSNNTWLKSPSFFVAEDDSTFKSTEYFFKNSEAQRRISFFAHSLSTPIAEPIPIDCMPTFTVLLPHYSEKIILTLKEIIKQTNSNSKITLLEYLKNLYPHEWNNFVRDTKMLAYEFGYLDFKDARDRDELYISNKINDLPFYSIGFNSSNEEFVLRTCIWASLRSQTLYRTVSGFQNYSKAIKLLHRIESPEMIQMYGTDLEGLNKELDDMANRKFKMVLGMQRYNKFSREEFQATEFLLKIYPNLKISYLEESKNKETNTVEYFSCLIDGFCAIDESNKGKRKPIYKIKLSGNPILGDGKSDNQNHSLIFYRGEYIQVIDANQDNYLEECLKIRSVLSEFDELDVDNVLPYIPEIEYKEQEAPVAIIGAREYIFSENIGVLGDIAAGKEQTFGTLFARTLAEIGGKLHYGHPDFLNGIFMTTRGGVSKSQKGLHLNEDIYAGMNAICRGGRIKHSDYYQCGKGRDLGFGSILNFTNKIGAGMGEQLLSREYYYLGTQLPIDRFLSFFYAHPGFHLNNLFISLSVQLFFILLLNLGSMNHELISCFYKKDVPIVDLDEPLGCYNLKPVLNWVTIFVLSIFIVFFISFCPLFIQEMLERGIWKAISRFFHHLMSFAPIFEVFVCQIYSNSLISDMSFGSAKYISTGRGVAITRMDFPNIYSQFSTSSIYTGSKIFLMLLFSIVSMWQPALLWFVITLVSLNMAPFFFNPHQFSPREFFIDYRNLMVWFFDGNKKFVEKSWINYTRLLRARYCRFKKKLIGEKSEQQNFDIIIVEKFDMILTELLAPLFIFIFSTSAYFFINSQTGVHGVDPTMSSLRLFIIVLLPLVLNVIIIVVCFVVSVLVGPIMNLLFSNYNNFLSGLCHIFSVFNYLLTFEMIFIMQNLNFTRSLVLIITAMNAQLVLFRLVTLFLLSRELKSHNVNQAWWSGKWIKADLGWSILTLPLREFVVKLMESTYFAADFLLVHMLLIVQTPILFLPFVDTLHSMVLYWLKPKQLIFKKQISSNRLKKLQSTILRKYGTLYVINVVILSCLFSIPILMKKFQSQEKILFMIQRNDLTRITLLKLFQPSNQNNNDTGPIAQRLSSERN